MDDHLNQQIGNYKTTAFIAKGNFGVVYKAQHSFMTSRKVAVKFLRTHIAETRDAHDLFLKEAEVLSNFNHPNILKFHDFGIDENGYPYLVTEYASNGSLRDRINKNQPMSLEEIIILLTQIGQALHYAHRLKVIHRDLKPENILFSERDEALLADFGIAAMLGTLNTRLCDVAGTPPYMAPEQFDGQASKRSDQYALACIAYELVTGRRPFDHPPSTPILTWGAIHKTEQPVPPRELNPELPAYLERTILTGLAKERTNRYQHVEAFVTSLRVTKEHWLAEGRSLLQAQRYDDALAAFEKTLQLAPEMAEAHIGRGQVYLSLNRPEEALRAFEKAHCLSSNQPEVWIYKGQALFALKSFEKALVAFEHALVLLPAHPEVHYELGRCLYQLRTTPNTGRQYLARALTAYEEAIRLDARESQYHLGRGKALYELRRFKEALKAFEQALRLDPDSAAGYNWQGRALYKLRFGRGKNVRDFTEVIAAFDKAIELDPQVVSYQENKARLLQQIGQHEEALLVYEEIIQLNTHSPEAYYNKGNLLYKIERYAEARENFSQALERDQTNARYQGYLARTLHKLQNYEAALEAFEQSIRLYAATPEGAHDRAEAWNNKARTLYKLKRYDETLHALKQAINLHPENARYHDKLGQIYFERAHYVEALGAIEQAIRLESKNAEAHNCKGRSLFELKRYSEAVDAFEQALRLEPGNHVYRDNKSLALQELKRSKRTEIDIFDEDIQLERPAPIARRVAARNWQTRPSLSPSYSDSYPAVPAPVRSRVRPLPLAATEDNTFYDEPLPIVSVRNQYNPGLSQSARRLPSRIPTTDEMPQAISPARRTASYGHDTSPLATSRSRRYQTDNSVAPRAYPHVQPSAVRAIADVTLKNGPIALWTIYLQRKNFTNLLRLIFIPNLIGPAIALGVLGQSWIFAVLCLVIELLLLNLAFEGMLAWEGHRPLRPWSENAWKQTTFLLFSTIWGCVYCFLSPLVESRAHIAYSLTSLIIFFALGAGIGYLANFAVARVFHGRKSRSRQFSHRTAPFGISNKFTRIGSVI